MATVNLKHKLTRYSAWALVLSALSGCVLAPAIQSLSELGVRGRDRQKLLAQQVKRFNDALYWGNPTEALAFASHEERPRLASDMQKRLRDERIVESKIEAINYSPNAFAADVDVVVRYFKVPYYMVNERREKQRWEYSVVAGWQLMERESQVPG